jgi:hypothetical protein
MMEPGDRVILWESGNGRRMDRGIWGKGLLGVECWDEGGCRCVVEADGPGVVRLAAECVELHDWEPMVHPASTGTAAPLTELGVVGC